MSKAPISDHQLLAIMELLVQLVDSEEESGDLSTNLSTDLQKIAMWVRAFKRVEQWIVCGILVQGVWVRFPKLSSGPPSLSPFLTP